MIIVAVMILFMSASAFSETLAPTAADWATIKYTLTYNLDGGLVSPDNPISYDIETETFTLTNPIKTGYSFTGWSGTNLDVLTKTVTIEKGSVGNREYTANWFENKTPEITLVIKKTLTSNDVTFNPPSNLVSNGKPKSANFISKVDGIGNFEVEYYDSEGNRLDATPTEPGTYTVKLNVAEGTDYNAAILEADNWTFTIVPYTVILKITLKVAFDYSNWSGKGTTEAPYVIGSVKALNLLSNYLDMGYSTRGLYFSLSEDIEFGETDTFTPIGTQSKPFEGMFDGGNHKVSGINYSGDSQYAGLFGYVDGGMIENVILENCKFETSYDEGFAGSIAGFMNSGDVQNSAVVGGSVKAENGIAGGIAGNNDGIIKNSLYLGNSVTGKTSGAVVGENSGTVESSYYTDGNLSDYYAVRGYTVSLDRTVKKVTLDYIFSEDVNFESTDSVQVSNLMLIFRGKVYAGASVDVSIEAKPDEYYDVKALNPESVSLGENRYSFKMPARDVTVSATGTPIIYTVSYDLQGGTVSSYNIVSYDISSETFKLTNPTRTGYTFIGWSGTGIEGVSTDITIAKGSTGNREYTANWMLNVYTLSYDLNGGIVSPDNPTSYTIESADIKLTQPTKLGYEFAGWSFDAEISLDVTIPNGSTGNGEYIATWTVNEYIISYTLNNGNVSGNPTKYTIETETFTLTNPSKNGYQFDGWTGTDLSGKTPNVTIAKGSTGDRNYTANFTPITYTVTYELNGGVLSSNNPEIYTIESADFTLNNPTSYNYETQSFTLNNPIREGYEFLGWSIEGEEGLSNEIEIPEGTTGDRKYIANWKATEYTINYELNGGTVSLDNPAKYTIESENFTLMNPTKTGYTFEGWTGTSVDVTMSKDVTIPTGSTGNREYVANWMKNVLQESPDVLQSIIVEISGDEMLTTNAETSVSITFKANVKGTYSREQTRALSSDSYVLTWTMDNVEGLSFSDGTLTVNEAATFGTHGVEITGNEALTTLNLAGSKVEMVDAKGCENLEEANLEGCENLEYLDVSETPITVLNVQDCKNLGTLNCASCDISYLSIEGCEKLETLDCRNNSLSRLDLTAFNKLHKLECRDQHIYGWPKLRQFNILDLLFLRIMNVSSSSETDTDTSDIANVKDIKAYDENGNEIFVKYDEETGEVTFSEAPFKIKYNYITGFNGVLMDVSVLAKDENEEEPHGAVSSSSGCNAGFGAGFGVEIISLILTCFCVFFIL